MTIRGGATVNPHRKWPFIVTDPEWGTQFHVRRRPGDGKPEVLAILATIKAAVGLDGSIEESWEREKRTEIPGVLPPATYVEAGQSLIWLASPRRGAGGDIEAHCTFEAVMGLMKYLAEYGG